MKVLNCTADALRFRAADALSIEERSWSIHKTGTFRENPV